MPARQGPPDAAAKDYKNDGQGLGSLGLHLKTRFLKTSRAPYVGLGVIGSIFLPTTNPKQRFLGEESAVPQVIGILDKEFGREARFRVALNGGIRARKTQTFTDSTSTDGGPVTNQTVTIGAEVPYGLGLAYAISKQKFATRSSRSAPAGASCPARAPTPTSAA